MFLQVPRDVHPVIWFNATSIRPKLLESFAFDKYELEPSPLTQHILEKRDPNLCWQVVYFSVYFCIFIVYFCMFLFFHQYFFYTHVFYLF